MDWYHSKLGKNEHDTLLNPIGNIQLLTYKWYLESYCPEIANIVEIGFIRGSNMTKLCFSHDLGLKSEKWISFVYKYVCDPIDIYNCVHYGIKEIVFCINDEIFEYSPGELLILYHKNELPLTFPGTAVDS